MELRATLSLNSSKNLKDNKSVINWSKVKQTNKDMDAEIERKKIEKKNQKRIDMIHQSQQNI